MSNPSTNHQTENFQPFRNFKGIWIPREIWLQPDLSILEKMLWAEIDSLDHPQNGCTASNQYFCKFFNIQERVLQKALSRLRNLDLIIYESFDGRTRVLRSNLGKTSHEKFDTSEVNDPKTTHEFFDTSAMNNLTPLSKATPIVYNKEDNKVPPLTPPKPEQPKSEPASKEEEEEIEKRFRERPENCLPIRNRSAWEDAVLKEIRNATNSDKELDRITSLHRREANGWDMQKIGEITVYACHDRVEFTCGSYCKQVYYRISDEEWKAQVLWRNGN